MTSPNPSPGERSLRFSLRLHPDEMAAVEDLQERMGGGISANSAIAQAIAEAHYYRVAAIGVPCLPVTALAFAVVRDTADELAVPLYEAHELLIRRGAPHQPQRSCMFPQRLPAGALPPPPPPFDRLPTTPHQDGPPLPRYATPQPCGLPPVQPVPGQISADGEAQ